MKPKSITKIIRFFKKHVRLETLDDIYTPKEKKELMAHWKKLEDAHNKRVKLTKGSLL